MLIPSASCSKYDFVKYSRILVCNVNKSTNCTKFLVFVWYTDLHVVRDTRTRTAPETEEEEEEKNGWHIFSSCTSAYITSVLGETVLHFKQQHSNGSWTSTLSWRMFTFFQASWVVLLIFRKLRSKGTPFVNIYMLNVTYTYHNCLLDNCKQV